MNQKAFIAYKIICVPTGKIYIGITSQSLSKRWNQHVSHSKNNRSKLARAIVKYGAGDFLIEKIQSCETFDALLKLEIELIQKHDSFRTGLNSTCGGDGVLGIIHTPESKLKMSKLRKAIWNDPNYRNKISVAQKSAWKRKSKEEIERRRIKCLETFSLNPPPRRTKRPKPLRWRGKGWNMRIKTHCPKGHPYNLSNTIISVRGGRVCRACKRLTRNTARNMRVRQRRGLLLK